MKSFILIALSAVLSVCLGAAVQQSQRVITAGVAQPGDWALITNENQANPQPNFVYLDYLYSVSEREHQLRFQEDLLHTITMKSYILIALLAVLSVCLGAAVQRSQLPITVGVAQPGDWVLTRNENRANPQPNFVSQITVQNTLHPKYKINFITFMDQDPSQGGFVSFVGGLGTNDIIIRITSQRGGGFHFITDLWGQDTTEQTNSMRSIVHANCTMTVDDGKTIQTSACN
uniref:Uncharacterized protein n=1 Tax=Heliothis virescens TaxID=7102 RepID=A0A2A4J459_HELVI